ncbi:MULTISPECIES: GDSL-type esterase/lipase family protein [unclassified Pseudoalteromonas]|uniref:GDSL-type esterase/lipase family protein n=1 Tax=unclassified Pseudoalteromonas TaxID=194690 RepID=UPI002580EC27|nr:MULTISPECIES: GDSL-type esterase/lipase family protein [unclassified Pseudoalteromonas]|tara:strand:- start:8946 stop:9569 length:624 start_codon:yes stop_codon:yes gene_type:complete
MTQITKNILCFGDSNTWGLNPETGKRYDEKTRWTARLQQQLGSGFSVIESGQPNRTLVNNPPFTGELNGIRYLKPDLQQHALHTLIIALGTNDLKKRFNLAPTDIATGLTHFIGSIKQFYSPADLPNIIVIGPLFINPQHGSSHIYLNCSQKLQPLNALFKRVAHEHALNYVDISHLNAPIGSDGIHLNSQGHKQLSDILSHLVLQL